MSSLKEAKRKLREIDRKAKSSAVSQLREINKRKEKERKAEERKNRAFLAKEKRRKKERDQKLQRINRKEKRRRSRANFWRNVRGFFMYIASFIPFIRIKVPPRVINDSYSTRSLGCSINFDSRLEKDWWHPSVYYHNFSVNDQKNLITSGDFASIKKFLSSLRKIGTKSDYSEDGPSPLLDSWTFCEAAEIALCEMSGEYIEKALKAGCTINYDRALKRLVNSRSYSKVRLLANIEDVFGYVVDRAYQSFPFESFICRMLGLSEPKIVCKDIGFEKLLIEMIYNNGICPYIDKVPMYIIHHYIACWGRLPKIEKKKRRSISKTTVGRKLLFERVIRGRKSQNVEEIFIEKGDEAKVSMYLGEFIPEIELRLALPSSIRFSDMFENLYHKKNTSKPSLWSTQYDKKGCLHNFPSDNIMWWDFSRGKEFEPLSMKYSKTSKVVMLWDKAVPIYD